MRKSIQCFSIDTEFTVVVGGQLAWCKDHDSTFRHLPSSRHVGSHPKPNAIAVTPEEHQEVGYFEPLHEKHAIEQVIVQVNFDRPLPENEFSPPQKWQRLNAELNGRLPAFLSEPGLQFTHGSPVPKPGFSAHQLAYVGPDGIPLRLLRLERGLISYAATDYTRWEIIKKDAWDVIRAALEGHYLPNDLMVISTTLHYFNRFRWVGKNEEMVPSQLLRRDSPWIAPKLYHQNENWHCHCGEFRKQNAAVRRLINVNTDVVSQESPSGPSRSVSVSVMLVDALNQTGYEKTDGMTGDIALTWISNQLDDLHTAEKIIMAEVISTELQDRISLEAI
jgi:uncharacterized protein (TIGR04255 family)